MSSSNKHTETRKPAKTIGGTDKQAMKDFDAHAIEGENVDPVPLPDQGGHAHSHAAHLSGKASKYVNDKENAQNKPEGNLRHGAHPTGLREPPQNVSRVGKGHRGE